MGAIENDGEGRNWLVEREKKVAFFVVAWQKLRIQMAGKFQTQPSQVGSSYVTVSLLRLVNFRRCRLRWVL